MEKTIFHISKMDCPSEENLIRMKLAEITHIQQLAFDIPKRTLTVLHTGNITAIEQSLIELNLGAEKCATEAIAPTEIQENQQNQQQRKWLWAVLLINFAFFLIEISTGFISNSMGLVADSLDMLADALVYGLSLIAVGTSIIKKKKIATLTGYVQITLALLGLIEVLRRFLGTALPHFQMMILISFFALIANGLCIYLLQKIDNKQEAHIKASMIFTSNDVMINLGVISAGVLVYLLDSRMPDLIIGILVFILVMQGAFRILKLGK